jgi:hypothetical protein
VGSYSNGALMASSTSISGPPEKKSKQFFETASQANGALGLIQGYHENVIFKGFQQNKGFNQFLYQGEEHIGIERAVTTLKVAKAIKKAGQYGALFGTAIDAWGLANYLTTSRNDNSVFKVTPGKFALNGVFTLIGLYGGAPGFAISGGYFLLSDDGPKGPVLAYPKSFILKNDATSVQKNLFLGK